MNVRDTAHSSDLEPVSVERTDSDEASVAETQMNPSAITINGLFNSSFVPVRVKVAVLLTIVAIGMIVLSGIFVYHNYTVEVRERNATRADYVRQMIDHSAKSAKTQAEFNAMLKGIESTPYVIFAAIIDMQGKVIGSTQTDWTGLSSDQVPELKSLSKDSPAMSSFARLSPEGASPTADYAGPLTLSFDWLGTSPEKTVVFIRLNTLTSPASIQARTWSFLSWLIGGVIFCALIISLMLQRLVIVPIEGLRRCAEKGDTASLVSPIGPPDEISHVAHLLVQSYYASNESAAKLADFAMTDGLTGLGNRLLFKGRLAREIAEAENSNSMIGVIILNLDNFKDINDTLGHDAGDYILQRTAENLKICLRKDDTVARLSADEFGIVLPGISTAEEAMEFAARVIRTVSMPIRVGLQDIYKSACVGVTLFPQDGRDPDVLIKNADLALTHAKQDGAGACILYRHELRLRVMQRNSIERDLRIALARKQFVLFYQPKFNIKSGKLVGMEALIRWLHPERGLVSPDTFISVAERAGVISEITCWVLDEACRQIHAWQESNLSPVSVAVNVSAIDLRRTDLTDVVATTLLRHSLSPQYLELEVTESMVMHNVDEVIGTLRRLRSLGVGIGIDDFGTGYSSLAYLKRFPVKRLKIDRSFVQDISETRDGAIIPKVIIDLAHSLNISVIAEGVETPEQLEILRGFGCDEAQGFLLGHPMPASEFETLLRNPGAVMAKFPAAGSAESAA